MARYTGWACAFVDGLLSQHLNSLGIYDTRMEAKRLELRNAAVQELQRVAKVRKRGKASMSIIEEDTN